MIYVLYMNSDLIEGKGRDVIVGISNDINDLMELMNDMPVAMGEKYSSGKIYMYNEFSKSYKPDSTYGVPAYPVKDILYRSGRDGMWYRSENYIKQI